MTPERAIKEISSGIFAFNNRVLFEKLEQVKMIMLKENIIYLMFCL